MNLQPQRLRHPKLEFLVAGLGKISVFSREGLPLVGGVSVQGCPGKVGIGQTARDGLPLRISDRKGGAGSVPVLQLDLSAQFAEEPLPALDPFDQGVFVVGAEKAVCLVKPAEGNCCVGKLKLSVHPDPDHALRRGGQHGRVNSHLGRVGGGEQNLSGRLCESEARQGKTGHTPAEKQLHQVFGWGNQLLTSRGNSAERWARRR